MKIVYEKSRFGVLKRGIGAAAVVGLMGIAGAVQANPMTVDIDFSVGSLFPAGSKNTHISYGKAPDSTQTWHVSAGMFSGVASDGVNFQVSSLYLDEGNVLAYCVDIVNWLLREQSTYNVNEVTPSLVDVDPEGVRRDFGRTLQFLGAANEVARRDYDIFEGDKNWLNPTTSWMSAAIQVGIWESLYEDSHEALDISDGWFFATTDDIGASGTKFLTDSFDLMGNAAPVDAGRVRWLQIDGGQDLLVDPVDVPAPAPLALLLAGLALMVRLRTNQ